MTKRFPLRIVLLLFIFSSLAEAESKKLTEVHQWIENNYPAVDHIDSTEYLTDFSEEGSVVLFDVREPDEFAVSHLKGALQIDPEMSAEEFQRQFGEKLVGKTAVFYCSVGRRSSLLADKVADQLFSSGTEEVFNLKHGIFGWHDKKMPLMSSGLATDFVHPYSWRWKRYLQRKDMTTYKPPKP